MILDVGRDRLTPSTRASAELLVALVHDGSPLLGAVDSGVPPGERARALAIVRRADVLVVPDETCARALSTVVPVAPWDMAIDRSVSPAAQPSGRQRRRPWRERRLAVVTPLPPEPTGVADYSARLAAALGRRSVVTCVVAGPDRAAPDATRRPAGTTLASVGSFGTDAEHGRFDEIVYVLGNHPLHGTQLALLRAMPGAVQLHDVRLVGAHAALHAPGPALAAEVARQYPGRYPSGTLAEPELTMSPAQAAGVWLVREVASLATTVLVHSAHAANLVRADAGIDAAMIGPLAVPAATAVPEPVDGGDALIVSVGVVHPSKRADLLVRALATLVARRPDAWLALVGPVDPGYRRELDALASELGVTHKVVLTGRVNDADYDAWLSRAAVAVQLRAQSNGESSAAVTDCLARGVPTVVTDEGAQAELADDVVVKVPAEAEATGIAAAIDGLLADTGRRRALHTAALAYAAANDFDAAAERLLTSLFGPDPG